MKGQWVGTYTGSTDGSIIVNVDERPSLCQGVAYLNESDRTHPSTAAFFKTLNKENDFQFRTDLILPIDPRSGVPGPWESIKQLYQEGIAISTYADVNGTWGSDSLKLSWSTEIGATGTCVLPRSMADKPSELVAEELTWETYKNHVAMLEPRKYLFRGQKQAWRLRTSFHRSGRADLSTFINKDIPVLHKHLSARTKHVFNLTIPDENGAFFNLIQHLDYPTPLLDWTYSPYVAAFFAYRGISNKKAAHADPKDRVRIHVFDQEQWRADWNQLLQLLSAGPHLSIGEFLAIENERMIPQQAASTFTNVDDIESYILSREDDDKKYLRAIDLPAHDRKLVIRELGVMGITAGSLFPGLDGACEELTERNFEI